MISKSLCLSIIVLCIFLTSVAAVSAQDVCVEEAFANSAMPTTIAEARQLLADLREVLAECDPPSEGVVELDVLREISLDGMYEDEYGCYVGVSFGTRASRPDVFVVVQGDGNANYLLELKRPGSQKWRAATDVNLKTFVDDPDQGFYLHEWDGYNWPKGQYEVRYEAFVGANPVTIAFDAEHNTRYRIDIACL